MWGDTVLVKDKLSHFLAHLGQSDSGVDGQTSSLLYLVKHRREEGGREGGRRGEEREGGEGGREGGRNSVHTALTRGQRGGRL